MTDDGPAPPALGVKENVACTAAFPATRSAAATANITLVTFVEHVARIPRRLSVPEHGSPNTEFEAETVQLFFPTHICLTISKEEAELQVPIAKPVSQLPVGVPYEANTILSIMLSPQQIGRAHV